MRTALLPLAAWILASACYSRQPLESPVPAPATRIAAGVTDSGAVALGSSLGPGVMALEGVVNAATDTEWTVYMLRVDHRDGRTTTWNRELVSLPRVALSDPVVVVLDKRRSWLAGAGITVGALLLARGFAELFGSDAGDRDDGQVPPAQSVAPRGGS